MQDVVLNLCRVKMRDQQRLAHGPLREYPQITKKHFHEAVPRSGNASGGGQPGDALKCKPGGPNDYIYVIIQPRVWEPLMKVMRAAGAHHGCRIRDARGAPPASRRGVRHRRGSGRSKHTKFEVMALLNEHRHPVRPGARHEGARSRMTRLRARGTDRRGRATRSAARSYTVGCPIKLSDSPVEVLASPLLGEHTEEVLKEIVGLGKEEIAAARAKGAI